MPALAFLLRMGATLAFAAPAAPLAGQPAPSMASLLERGDQAYFLGDYDKALSAYGKAAAASTTTARPWLEGGAILDEIGDRAKAAKWYAHAAELSSDPATLNALGWAQWRAGELAEAEASFRRALFRDPRHAYALLGMARVCLSRHEPAEAIDYLHKAEDAAPLLDLAPYYEGQAYEALSKETDAVSAFKKAAIADSYFLEARDALGRADLKIKDFNDAWRQFSKILEGEPHVKRYVALVNRLEPMLTRRPGEAAPASAAGRQAPAALPALTAASADVPVIRVGIGTDYLGKPKPRPSLTFKASSLFAVADGTSGRTKVEGDAGETWRVSVKKVKRKRLIVVADALGKAMYQSKGAVLLRPLDREKGTISVNPVSAELAGKVLRGALEVSLYKNGLRLVNVLDLETYTHGVLAAEMPINSPPEALKAQAIVARSHALFIMKVSRRHRRQGYDVCDGTHCQVYDGVRAETDRSRQIVEGTRGEVVLYKGKIAHVIYSSNCGGHTQSGRDLTGWGDVPYWSGEADATDPASLPRSPWTLKQWLTSWPQAFCQPSNDVHPSHYRWNRVIAWSTLDGKTSRKLRIGQLKSVRVLRRSVSGNVDALLVVGTRRKAKVTDEMQIRDLLALGPLRSTLFVMETEYDAKGKPQAVVFHGGGWGHGVGLCQSGAMGRAQAGETAEQIIKAYFKGVELGQLDYANSTARQNVSNGSAPRGAGAPDLRSGALNNKKQLSSHQ